MEQKNNKFFNHGCNFLSSNFNSLGKNQAREKTPASKAKLLKFQKNA